MCPRVIGDGASVAILAIALLETLLSYSLIKIMND
jgi:hypothetical protein